MTFRKLSRVVSLMLSLLCARWSVADVTSSSNPALVGQSVTFTVAIESPAVTAVPTGTVTFTDAGQSLATVPVQNGMAEFTTPFGTTGDHVIVAEYSGDANFQPANSPEFIEHVTADDVFTVSVSPSVVNQAPGGSSAVKVTLFSNGGTANSAHLACEDLPPGAACSFESDALVPSEQGNSTTVTVTSKAPQRTASRSELPGPIYAIFLVPLLFRKRRYGFVLVCALAITSLLGCGDTLKVTTASTPSGAYTIHVVGNDGVITQKASIQLNVS